MTSCQPKEIRALRLIKFILRMTHADLAGLAGISVEEIQSIERGEMASQGAVSALWRGLEGVGVEFTGMGCGWHIPTRLHPPPYLGTHQPLQDAG